MSILQIRQEPESPSTLTGADFTGADGATNRTYDLIYSNSRTEMFRLVIGGNALQQDVHFTLANDQITVLIPLYNSQAVTISYFTG